MQRTFFLTGTAIALSLASFSVAQAATCTASGAQIVCSAPLSDPLASADSGVTVEVESSGEIASDTSDTTAVALSGDGVAVDNAGRIAQTDTGKGGYAITGSGKGLSVTNAGSIASGDRAIEMLGGSDLTVLNTGTIEGRRQAIRSLEGVTGARVENRGTISSEEGRALQVRGNGATVINHGTLIGGEEVVEARGDFTLENYGTIKLNRADIEDEDGVQFAGGTVLNEGSITGSDDGIDLDEGRVTNAATGVIRSTAPDANENSGVDIDPVYDDGVIERANGVVEIVNAGLIEGPSAIGADDAATNSVRISNTGTLLGRGGTAIRLAPGQGDSTLSLSGDSRVFGDVLFGAGDDLLTIGSITSGLLFEGIFDAGLGRDTVLFDGFGLSALKTFAVSGDTVDLAFLTNGDLLSGSFANVDFWTIDDVTYTAAALSDAVSPASVPLPAGLPLLLAGLGGMGLLRRRRRG